MILLLPENNRFRLPYGSLREYASKDFNDDMFMLDSECPWRIVERIVKAYNETINNRRKSQ